MDIKNIKDHLPLEIREHYILSFMHGSYVYGTNNEKSDKDIVVIVDDNIDLKTDYSTGIKEIHVFPDNEGKVLDFQIINNNTFKKMLYEHHIIALESLFMKSDMYDSKEYFNSLYANYFVLDKWKLRRVILSIVNNSYAKCHKKLIIEKDYDLYRAQKSIFHCIRLYMFAIQIAEEGRIYDYAEANHYWIKIQMKGNNWDEYKKEYKPILNSLRSKLVKLCPKPI